MAKHKVSLNRCTVSIFKGEAFEAPSVASLPTEQYFLPNFIITA